jgi:hypothetical protein
MGVCSQSRALRRSSQALSAQACALSPTTTEAVSGGAWKALP